MKRLFLLLLWQALGPSHLDGQSLPRLPQHIYWKTLLNPAAQPLDHILFPKDQDLALGISHRQQPGQRDGPQYWAVRFDWMNTAQEHLLGGAGVDLLSYQTGPLQRHAILGRVSFQHAIGQKWKLSWGLSPGLVFQQIDRGNLVVLHISDPVLAGLPAFQGQFTMGWGLFVNRKLNDFECIWAGLSMPQAYANPFRPNRMNAAPNGWAKGPLYAMAGIRKQSKSSFDYRPYFDIDLLLKAEYRLPFSLEPAFKTGIQNVTNGADYWIQTGYSTGARMFFLHFGFQPKVNKDKVWYLRTNIGFDRYLHPHYVAFRDNFEINLTFYRRK